MMSFILNDEEARAWLAKIIAEDDEAGSPAGEVPAARPSIGPAWDPRNPGEEDDIYLLVRGAQEAGALTAPPGAEIDFEFSDDTDGGYYRYLLDLSTPAPLKLASYAEEMRKVGAPDETGMEAAIAILREAEDAGNYLLRQLSEFTSAGWPRSARRAGPAAPAEFTPTGPPALPAGSRLDALGTLQAQAGEQIALLSMLAIGRHLHASCPSAAVAVLEWSDQGPNLTAAALLDSDGQQLAPDQARDVMDLIEPYCANLGEDNEQTWGAYLDPGTAHGQQLLLPVASALQIREPGECGTGPAEITYGAATLACYLACQDSPDSDMYALDVLGLRILVRRRAADTYVHIDTQESSQPPLLPLAVEVNNGGETTNT